MERICYIGKTGGFTEDPSKAKYGEIKDRKELRTGRFSIGCNGMDLIFTEQEIGLPAVKESKKAEDKVMPKKKAEPKKAETKKKAPAKKK